MLFSTKFAARPLTSTCTNPNFKKVHDSLMSFTNNGYQWFRVAELTYDSFMARNAQS